MPPPPPPPGFTLEGSSPARKQPPAPPAGFELELPPLEQGGPSPETYAAATPFGKQVYDSATSGPVYGPEWLRGQLEHAPGGPPPPPPGFTLESAAAPAAPPPAPELGFGDTIGNLARGVGERFRQLTGGMSTTVGALGEQWAAKHPELPSIVIGGEKGFGVHLQSQEDVKRQLEHGQLGDLSEILQSAGEESQHVSLGYQPMTQWQDVKSAEGIAPTLAAAAKFALEQGVISAPDMAAVLATLPGYALARTGELSQARADYRKQQTGEDQHISGEDLAIGGSAAAASALLERFGAEKVLEHVPGLDRAILTRILKAGAAEGGTEAAQEVVEYAGERENQGPGSMSLAEALDRAAGAAVGGAGAGVGIHTGAELASTVANAVSPRKAPGDAPAPEAPEGAPAEAALDVEAQLGAGGFGDEVESAAPPAAAPRAPAPEWTADPDAGEGVPFAFLGPAPETAAAYLTEEGDKIVATLADGTEVGRFLTPNEAAIAVEDTLQTSAPSEAARPAAAGEATAPEEKPGSAATVAQGLGDTLEQAPPTPPPGFKLEQAPSTPVGGFGDLALPEPAAAPAKAPHTSEAAPPFATQTGTAEQGVTAPAEAKSTVQSPNLQPGAAIPEAAAERRTAAGAARRKKVAEMSPAELRGALLTHELTGIPNRRAYEEAQKLPSQTAIDVDSLKWVNDNMGHDSGNELLKAVGDALREEGGPDVYHLSGDEFALQARTDEEAAAAMKRVNDRLAGAVISVTMPDGTVHTLSGMGVSYGTGKDLSAADARLQAHKTEREARGERAGRGVAPPGATSVAAEEGRQDHEGGAPAGAEEEADRASGAPSAQAAGEHVTLAGPFAKSEAAAPEDVQLSETASFRSLEQRRAQQRAAGEEGDSDTELEAQLSGEMTAEEKGYAARIQRMLGGAKNAPRIRFIDGLEGMPRHALARLQATPGLLVGGAYDPQANEVYINTKAVKSAGDAAWVAAHEIAGHYGLRGLVGRMAKDARTRLDKALALAAQNPTVEKLAQAIQAKRPKLTNLAATEEALAELAASLRTGDYARLKERYDVDVPARIRGRVERTLQAFLERLRALLDRVLGKGQEFSDKQVRELLEGAWRYVKEGESAPAKGLGDEMKLTEDEVEKAAAEVNAILEGEGTPKREELEALIEKNTLIYFDLQHDTPMPGQKETLAMLASETRESIEGLLRLYRDTFGADELDKLNAQVNKKIAALRDDYEPDTGLGDELAQSDEPDEHLTTVKTADLEASIEKLQQRQKRLRPGSAEREEIDETLAPLLAEMQRRAGEKVVTEADVEKSGRDVEALLEADTTPAREKLEAQLLEIARMVHKIESEKPAAERSGSLDYLRDELEGQYDALGEHYWDAFGEKQWLAFVKKMRAELGLEDLSLSEEPRGVDAMLEQLRKDNPGVTVEAYIAPTGELYISTLTAAARGKGKGSKALAELLAWADEQGLAVSVSPVSREGRGVELEEFYARQGFAPVKKGDDARGTWIRQPRPLAATTGKPQAASGGAGKRYVQMYRSKGAPQAAVKGATVGTAARSSTLEIPKEPIRREHVMKLFQRLFKLKIYEGKPWPAGLSRALGYFRPSNFEIRNKDRSDLEVAAHEVFHWIDRTYPTIRKLYHKRRFADELYGVSYDDTKIFEGFAEFGRLFMTQEPEAITRLPTFYEAFVKEARDAGILDKLEQVQKLMHQWYLQGAENRGRSKIGTAKAPIRQRLAQMADGFTDRAIASSLDRLQAAKVIERETKGSIADDAAMSPYKSMRLLAGARSTINTFLNHGTLKWTERGDLDFSGKGLRQIFEPVHEVFDEAMGYFVAQRAAELRKYGKENLFSPDEIAALRERAKKTGKLEAIERAHEQYQAYSKRLLGFAEQSGILSAKTRAVWEQMYQNYVPFYRVAEKFGSLDPRMAGGTRGGLFRRLTGGTANVADVFENITLNTALIVHASLKNVAKRQLFAAIESSPVGQRYAVRIPPAIEVRRVAMEQIQTALRKFAAEADEKASKGLVDAMEAAEMAQLARMLANRSNDLGQATMADMQEQATFFFTGKPPTIPDKEQVLVNGKPRWYQVGDPLLWDMLTELNYHQPIGITEKVFGVAKRALTRGVTVTPEFQIANIIRDTFNAFALSKGGQLPVVDALKAIADVWKESDDYKLFLANGGGFGNAIGDEAKKLRVQMKATGTRRVLAMPAELIDWWDKWGQSFELATRLAEYKRVRDKGATMREAAYQGREVSTDFAMRGNSALARWASISLAFFNARLQGLYRLERELFEQKGRQSWTGERALAYASRAFLGLTLPSLLVYWFLNRDDDDYESLGEEVKSLNTVLPSPDGNGVILIPRPFETGALFQEAPIRLWEYFRKRDGEKLARAGEFMIANTFNFNPVPQAVSPPIDVFWKNRQWNGLPVVPRSLENVEPREQFQPWTSETFKKVGEQFNVSPLKLEQLVNGYFGTLGIYMVAASDALVSAGGPEEPTKKLSQYPLFRRFMREQPYANTSFEERFYDMLDQTSRVVDTARLLRRQGRTDDLEHYLSQQDKAVLFALSSTATDVAERGAAINALIRGIRQDPQLSAKEKSEQIDELMTEQNGLFKDAVKALDAARLEELRDALERAPP